MTDVNASEFQSVSSRLSDESNNSFILNRSNVPMDIDVNDDDDDADEILTTRINGYRSSTIENGNNNNNEHDKEDVFHQGNPVLNKSFDVLPQIKDDDTPSADQISDKSMKDTNVLDTTVELPNNSDELDAKPSQGMNNHKPVNAQSLLSNQFSLEYPYVIPQPIENTQPSSPLPSPTTTPIETVTALTKTMKLNVNKTLEGQEPSTTDKTFDTNTFVLKKKDRRKLPTEHSFNTTMEDTPPDLFNKQSPFNTPSTSLNVAGASRPATTQAQQPLTDPTRVM